MIARGAKQVLSVLAGVWILAGVAHGADLDAAGSSTSLLAITEPHGEPRLLGELPGPRIADADWPAVARWPALRHSQPLRLLVVTEQRNSAAVFRRIGLRLRASVEYVHVGVDDQTEYHVNDKWIEPKENPTREELAKAVLDSAIQSVQPRDGHPPAEVIVVNGNAAGVLYDLAVQEGLLASIRAGAVLVACGSVYPKSDSPLAAVWPMKAKAQNSWMSGGATREPGAALAGVPVEWLAGHTWIPVSEPAEGAAALALGESGAGLWRKVERGAIVAIPTGPLSRHWAAVEKLHRRYDHDEIWLRLWDHLLYELVCGTEAFPAYGDLPPIEGEIAAGQTATVRGKVVNRTARGSLAVAVHVTNPRGEVVFRKDEAMDVAAGQERTYEIRLPVAADWSSGLYPVYLTVGDPQTQRQYHQSLELLAVAGTVTLGMTADKRGYRLGEEAAFTVTASNSQAWSGELAFGVYDFRGRLLAVQTQRAELSAEKREFTFKYRVADHGVRVDTHWAEVVARNSGEWARAEVKFYKYEPWSTRNEYQWSTWAGIACGPPSTVPAGMRLMAHAGMNALGYPGRSELHYAAERWGWRYYNEGIGMNTFSPVIEYENDAEIEAALLKEAERSMDSRDLTSAAFVLGSVGEEAGFKHGWGTRYYWETPVAPDKACRAWHWFLKRKYASPAELNAAWKTNYASWDEVKLTREFSGRAPAPGADGWARPKESPLGTGVSTVSLAPYADTAEFYNWYYDRIVDAARRIFRERINPVTLAMSSAPTIGAGEYDVRQAGPSAWNESQWHSIADGPEPGFGLIWGHFDWSVKTDNMFWGFLLMRSGHNNYWVDVPLMFNSDLTHTRSSFAMRQWTHRLAGHERIILDSRPPPSEVGLLPPNGLGLDNTRGNMAISLQVALSQAGFGLPTTDPAKLDACKIVFAVGRQAVSAAEAERLQRYVTEDGILVFTPRFASQTDVGAAQSASPGCGLAEHWNFRVTQRQDVIPQYHPGDVLPFPLDGVGDALRGMKAAGLTVFREKVQHDGWTTLAEYADGTPALLTRTWGRGRLVYLNAIYQSHHYIQWVTPTGPERQGFYKLVEWLCEQAGVSRTLRLDGRLDEVLHVAVKQFTDPTGQIRYAILRTSGEVPWVSGTLKWLGPQIAGYDVLGGAVGEPSPTLGQELPFVFRPGDGRLLAFTARPVKQLVVGAASPRRSLGDSIPLTVEVLDASGSSIPGAFPLELRVVCGSQEISGLRRSFSVPSGGTYTLQTALSDPPGAWTISVRDGITGLSATTTVEVAASPSTKQAPAFIPWGWPSEIEEPAALSSDQFLDRLQKLSRLYLTDQSGAGWMTKQRLGYYYDLFRETRHALLRPLHDLDWNHQIAAIRRAVESGATLVLTGEDVNLHSGSGLAVYPHRDGHQLAAVHAALAGATWTLATRDGDTIAASLGQGRVLLCRESIDAAGHDNPSVTRWQQRWLSELKAAAERPVPVRAPTLDLLAGWWTGRQAITAEPRVVTWFGDNRRQVELSLDPSQPLGAVFTLTVPPTGAVQDVQFTLSSSAASEIALDFGGEGSHETVLRTSEATLESPVDSWFQEVARRLEAASHRDDNGWRVLPVRVTATTAVKVVLSGLEIVVQGGSPPAN